MSACAPVLLLAFNRPRHARAAVEAIRAARPSRLYVAADGPRTGRPGEAEACRESRAAALAAVDWPCTVQTLFRDENLGCARSVHGALGWFFDHEPEGIVIEDDCVAAPAFFRFCTELLGRFRREPRVFAISGDNFIEAQTPGRPSYWFNGVFHCWGWATWRDRWQAVPLAIDAPDAASIRAALRRAGLSRAEAGYWTPLFDRVRRTTDAAMRIDSWAYPAAYHAFVNRHLCVTPARNLVQNTGFGADSTHFDAPGAGAGKSVAAADLSFPLDHPAKVELDRALHRLNLRRHFGIRERGLSGWIERVLPARRR